MPVGISWSEPVSGRVLGGGLERAQHSFRARRFAWLSALVVMGNAFAGIMRAPILGGDDFETYAGLFRNCARCAFEPGELFSLPHGLQKEPI